MAGMSYKIRERTDADLDAAGNTTAAIGKVWSPTYDYISTCLDKNQERTCLHRY